jgi:plasmid stabilization system protein ParE
MRLRTVRLHADFEADYVAQLEWLVSREERDWIVNLETGLEEVIQLLSVFPEAGTVVAERGTVVLRKIIFPKGPYVGWYVYDTSEPHGEVWLARLFHARQKRPAPSPRRWARRSQRRR